MGFKWAVQIAHRFARSCFDEAYQSFARQQVSTINPLDAVKTLTRSSGITEINTRDALLMHILDDIKCGLFGWSEEACVLLQTLCVETIESSGVPIEASEVLADR